VEIRLDGLCCERREWEKKVFSRLRRGYGALRHGVVQVAETPLRGELFQVPSNHPAAAYGRCFPSLSKAYLRRGVFRPLRLATN
jgi:hypothetical protein